MSTFYPLDETTALSYVENASFRNTFFKPGEKLQCVDLADGNVNLVFRVSSASDPLKRSVLVKQALPYARRYPDFKMPLERARIEHGILEIQNRYCSGLAPKTYHYDTEMFINVMEDLNQHIIMREGLMKQVEYRNFSRDIGIFMARTLFYTSDLFLSSEQKKTLVTEYMNPVLCKVTEDLVLTFPFGEHETNRYPEELKAKVLQFQKTPGLQSRVRELKLKFMTSAESVLHGDLHTGSIMVNAAETRVIDPEFGFCGPMAFDIGSLIGNLIIGFYTQSFHAPDTAACKQYRGWLTTTMKDTWTTFDHEFRRLWNEEGTPEWRNSEFQADFLKTLFSDTLGFAACEMTRRTIGMAHVPDIDTITDAKLLASISGEILEFSAKLLSDRKISTMNEVLTALEESL